MQMNRFIIDHTPEAIAQSLCDKHVVKMPLEEAQMLSTVVRQLDPDYADKYGLYRVAHKNHPCTLWAGMSRSNYLYSLHLFRAMLHEYTHRYGKYHASERLLPALSDATWMLDDVGMTDHPECFGEHVHLRSHEPWPVESYRKFYKTKQQRFHMVWSSRPVPEWFEDKDYVT
jgi:hypothetical protein